MSLLSLTPDVLTPVLGLISTSDALALARVSRAAHDLALPHILAHVTLGGAFHRPAYRPSPNAELRAFCAALHAHPERIALVRSLELRRDAVRKDRTYETDADAVSLLASVLARASGLQCVTLWGFAQLVDAYPGIVDALACCDRLQTVILGGEVPPLDVLQRAFPYVRTLEFVEGGGACFRSAGSRSDLHSGPHPSTGPCSAAVLSSAHAWSSLDRLSAGRAPALSHAAHPLHARRLVLEDTIPNDEAVIEDTLAFIKYAQPFVFSVTIDADVPDDAFVERLHEVCIGDGRNGYAGVRFLELALSGCTSLAAVEDWMTRTASTLADLPLAGLALRSATPAAFPTPRPTPATSPLSSPPLGPTTTTLDADVSALALDNADIPAMAPAPGDDRRQTVYGAPRRAPPALDALAKTVGAAAPNIRWLALAPAGPSHDEHEEVADPAVWFEVRGTSLARPRCLDLEEAALVRRTLEGLGRWD